MKLRSHKHTHQGWVPEPQFSHGEMGGKVGEVPQVHKSASLVYNHCLKQGKRQGTTLLLSSDLHTGTSAHTHHIQLPTHTKLKPKDSKWGRRGNNPSTRKAEADELS